MLFFEKLKLSVKTPNHYFSKKCQLASFRFVRQQRKIFENLTCTCTCLIKFCYHTSSLFVLWIPADFRKLWFGWSFISSLPKVNLIQLICEMARALEFPRESRSRPYSYTSTLENYTLARAIQLLSQLAKD